MAWETRARGGRYYTRSRRVGGRVVREYVGTGVLAELVAERDAAERRDRAEWTAALGVERERAAPAEAALDAGAAVVEALVGGALVSAGYRRHHRGEWRKRRGDQAQG